MKTRIPHALIVLAGSVCLGALVANSAKAAPARPLQIAFDGLAAAQPGASDASITKVYWGYRYGRRYWVEPHPHHYYHTNYHHYYHTNYYHHHHYYQ
jgi:hypothetical protein